MLRESVQFELLRELDLKSKKMEKEAITTDLTSEEELEVTRRNSLENQEVSEIEKTKEASYKWVTHGSLKDMIMMSEDLGELSIYGAGEAVFKSHVYSALGAILFNGENMIIWVDYPLEKIKNYHGTVKKESSRIYWQDTCIKRRNYGYLETCQKIWGLSPAMQCFKFLSDNCLSKYGLHIHHGHFDFVDEKRPVRYLEIDAKEINQDPMMTKIRKWVEEEDNTKDEKKGMEPIVSTIKKKMEADVKKNCTFCKKGNLFKNDCENE